ncbi:MAG TPA: hypothetical protein DEO70_02320 [Bacteroidales bacterium]|nr:MAG: hypothetical protein A2X11_05770 [Bacteroidetes bacterium GWE2_42_24]OFY31263.1 MAG: hypothetical protein A2X09_10580 [Bacteroidetes bacterium GWF2_43_11]HBZ65642.1 hypothetical protein [Bacteroidales bacterium]
MNLIKKLQLHFFWLPSVLMIADAISKLLFSDFWGEYIHLNSQNNILWFGIVELCCALIYIFPLTMSIGFFLITCYWSASIGIGIHSQQNNIFSLVMLFSFLLSFHWRGVSIFAGNMFGKKK